MKKIKFIALLCFLTVSGRSQTTIDTALTDYANFLAGKPCLSPKYKLLQEKEYYKKHLDITKKIWDHVNDTAIAKINAFGEEKKFISVNDTSTCFYPFGGPDLLFANVFYPNAKNYVLMGLERLGTTTDITKKSDAEIEMLLNHLNQSMAYLNKSGYFVTSHMSKDFSKSLLNGTIHPVMYFAANRNFSIHSLKYGYINSKGEFSSYKSKGEKQYYQGYQLKLIDQQNKIREVFYFSADIADYKIKNMPWFVTFVKSFGKTTCFLKSASYIPAHKNFSLVRNLILDNCVKIIQDDTGIQYKILKDESKWNLEFWGLYTMTIKDLSWGFQPDLKEAVDKSPNKRKLPFRISYNGNYGEGILMVATKK